MEYYVLLFLVTSAAFYLNFTCSRSGSIFSFTVAAIAESVSGYVPSVSESKSSSDDSGSEASVSLNITSCSIGKSVFSLFAGTEDSVPSSGTV